LRPGAAPFYSPKLREAWHDQPVEPPERFDWFSDMDAMNYLGAIQPHFPAEMTEEYCFGLNKIELAVLAGEKLFE
jgi:hypothetical protein